jgi:FAD synthase
VRLRFSAWVRDQSGFPSVPAMVAQIDRDCARIADLLGAGVLHV